MSLRIDIPRDRIAEFCLLALFDSVLPDLARGTGARSKQKDITLDSYIISATPYEDLRKKYGGRTWDREKFGEAHFLFLERSEE